MMGRTVCLFDDSTVRHAVGWVVAFAFVLGPSSVALADPVWTDIFDADPKNEDVVWDAVANADGEAYMTGYSNRRDHEGDMIVVKYGSDGERLWSTRLNSEENGDDSASAIALHPEGGVVIAGTMGGPFGLLEARSDWSDEQTASNAGDDDDLESDFAVARIAPDGSVAWQSRVDGPGEGDDMAVSVTIRDGAAYTMGFSGNGEGRVAPTVGKFSLEDGTNRWFVRDESDVGPEDAEFDFRPNDPTEISLDSDLLAAAPDGDLYATGLTGGEDAATRAWVARITADGTQKWRRTHEISGHYNGSYAIATDESDNAVVLGESIDEAGDATSFALEVSPGNEKQWEATLDAGSDYWTELEEEDDESGWIRSMSDVTTDSEGDVYAVGFERGNNAKFGDMRTVKFDGSSGDVVWDDIYDKGQVDAGNAIETTDDGGVYAVGGAGGLFGFEYVTVRYDASSGDRDWYYHWNGENTVGGRATSANTMPDSGVLVSGALVRNNGDKVQRDMGVVRFSNDEPNERGANITGGCAACMNAASGGSSGFVLVFFGLMFAGLRSRKIV